MELGSKALEKASLDKSRSPINISEDELFDNIRSVWQQLGRQPKYQEIKSPLSSYHARTYVKRFGSWNRSLLLFREWIQSEGGNNISNEISGEQKDTEQTEQESIRHKTKREISDRLRFRVLMRDGFSCKSCGASPSKTLGGRATY